MAHSSTIDVRFSEIDPYGHVNHAVYVSYFEVARTEALAACQLPLDKLAELGHQIVVTGIEVRYRRAATSGDQLTVETAISEMRRASSVWSQRILRGDEVLVTASVTAGVTDLKGKPCRPPDWLFPALQPLLD
jgi:acyl-CoA thioester hydrolase